MQQQLLDINQRLEQTFPYKVNDWVELNVPKLNARHPGIVKDVTINFEELGASTVTVLPVGSHEAVTVRLDSSVEAIKPLRGPLRPQLTPPMFEASLLALRERIEMRQQTKGMSAFGSAHEVLGWVHQETQEFNDAIHEKLSVLEKGNELLDVACACIWGHASMNNGHFSW